MRCPKCHSTNTKISSTDRYDTFTKRYCQCFDCNKKFLTVERYLKYQRGPKRGGKLPDTQGVKNGNAVLTEQNILDIRKLKQEGISNRAIAVIYGIDGGHVSRIVNYKVWTHV